MKVIVLSPLPIVSCLVFEFLCIYLVNESQVAASRSEKLFKSKDNDKPNKDDRAKLLLDWALDDFKPGGPQVFETDVQSLYLFSTVFRKVLPKSRSDSNVWRRMYNGK